MSKRVTIKQLQEELTTARELNLLQSNRISELLIQFDKYKENAHTINNTVAELHGFPEVLLRSCADLRLICAVRAQRDAFNERMGVAATLLEYTAEVIERSIASPLRIYERSAEEFDSVIRGAQR